MSDTTPTFTPEEGQTYAHRHSGKRFTFTGKKTQKGGYIAYMWKPEGSEQELPILPSVFEVAPVLNENMPGWDDLSYFPGEFHRLDNGNTLEVLNAFADDWYQCETNTNGRKKIRLMGLEVVQMFLGIPTESTPEVTTEQAAAALNALGMPYPPDEMAEFASALLADDSLTAAITATPAADETEPETPAPVVSDDDPATWDDTPLRIKEIEERLQKHNVFYHTITRRSVSTFRVTLRQPHISRHIARIGALCRLTTIHSASDWVDVEFVSHDLELEMDKVTHRNIDELIAKVATKDHQIAKLTQQIANQKSMLEETKKVVLAGGVQGNKRQAFIIRDVSEKEYDNLLNDRRVTVTATQFAIHPVTGDIQLCVAGYRSVYEPDETTRPAIARTPAATSLGTATGHIMADLAAKFGGAQVFQNGEEVTQ